MENDQPNLGQAPGGGVEINHLWPDPQDVKRALKLYKSLVAGVSYANHTDESQATDQQGHDYCIDPKM